MAADGVILAVADFNRGGSVMGNSAVAVKGIEALCCNSLEGEGQEDMISPDLAQALFMHEVPVHVNATMEEEVGQAVASLKESKLRRGLADEEDRSRRLLLTAVQNDDAPVVLQFVADGVAAADMGEALRLAAGRGSASVVRELVAVGLSVNDGCRGTGYTPLHLAAAGGHVVVCELLLDALADVHKQVDGITALSLARKMGNMEVEEVIERHVATLLMQDQGNVADEAAQYRRAHVLPRVSAMLSEAVLQAAPFEETPSQKLEEKADFLQRIIESEASNGVGREAAGPLPGASNMDMAPSTRGIPSPEDPHDQP